MLLPLYLTVVALGAGATWAYAVRHDAIAMMTLLATGAWGVAAIQAGTVVVYHQDGSSTTVSEPAFQYLMLGLSVLSFLAFSLWYFGEFPPEDGVEDELDPDGNPTSQGV